MHRVLFKLLGWALILFSAHSFADSSKPMHSLPQKSNLFIFEQFIQMQNRVVQLEVEMNYKALSPNELQDVKNDLQKVKIQLAQLKINIDSQKIQYTDQFLSLSKNSVQVSDRVTDMQSTTNWWLALLTIILAMGGLITYRQSNQEAKDVATKKMDEYITKQSPMLLKSAQKELEKTKRELEDEITKVKDSSINKWEQYFASIQEKAEEDIKTIKNKTSESRISHLTQDQKWQLDFASKLKPDSELTHEGWFKRCTAEYSNQEYSKALDSITNALNLADEAKIADDQFLSSAIFRKALIYWQLDDQDAEVKAYEELIALFIDSKEPNVQEIMANTLLNQAMTLDEEKQYAQALSTYETLITKFIDSEHAGVQKHVIDALINKAITLGDQKKPDQEISTYDVVITQFKDNKHIDIQEIVSQAFLNKALVFRENKQTKQESETYDALITQFEGNVHLEVQDKVAQAFMNKAITLDEEKQPEQAILAYDALNSKFKDKKHVGIQEVVAKASLNKGIIFAEQEQFSPAIAVFDALISRLKDSHEPEIHKIVSNIFLNKGVTLWKQGKTDQALAVLDALIQRFEDSNEPEIHKIVAKAFMTKASTQTDIDQPEQAIVTYETLVNHFAESEDKEIKNDVINALANLSELSILCEKSELTLKRIERSDANNNNNAEIISAMEFLRFLLDDKTIEDVFTKIDAIPTDVEINWGFSEIKAYVEKNYSGKKLQHCKSIFEYFEKHKNVSTLKSELEMT